MSEGHFEAKKHAYRQTQDGVVISFVCHPNDVAAAMAMAPLGTRYMVAFAEIGEDEKPIEGKTAPEEKPKERRKFEELPLSQQCAMTCADPRYYSEYLQLQTKEACEGWVKRKLGVASRSELDRDEVAAGKWKDMYEAYQAHMTTKKYADVKR